MSEKCKMLFDIHKSSIPGSCKLKFLIIVQKLHSKQEALFELVLKNPDSFFKKVPG